MITEKQEKNGMAPNPFSLMFGKEPEQMVARLEQTEEIVSTFDALPSPQQIYMITGVRGIGKTVFMSSIAKRFEAKNDWIVLELNSSGDLMQDFAAKLYNVKGMSKVFQTAGINLSFWGIGLDIKKADPITDVETAIGRMLKKVRDKKKRVLLTIDEVVNSKEMHIFVSAYQIFIRQDYPLYLLMTGLYENINSLQNEKNLTFLFRAPKVYLKKLNIGSMMAFYEKTLSVSRDTAREMAKTTMGYSFAFQVLGYFAYESGGDYHSAIPMVRQYLDEYVYDKIWTEITEKETAILAEMAVNNIGDVKSLKENLRLKPNEFSVYRDRLIKKGILDASERGALCFALPFFDEYVKDHV